MMDDSTGDPKLDGSFYLRAVRSAYRAGSTVRKNAVDDAQCVAEYFASGQVSETFAVRHSRGRAVIRKHCVKVGASLAG
jgi:hypothetical protein